GPTALLSGGRSRNCAVAARGTPSARSWSPHAPVKAKRPWPPERRGTPNSGPQKARCARTTVAPAPISDALTAWARADTATPTASPVAATTVLAPFRHFERRRTRDRPPHVGMGLAKRDVVGDADVGGEGGDDRAVLLEREIDGAASLGLVHADARDR